MLLCPISLKFLPTNGLRLRPATGDVKVVAMPAIPRKIDRVAALLVKECGLPALETGRRATQGVSQLVSEGVFINRHYGEISWHRVEPNWRGSANAPVLTIRLRAVPGFVEVVVTQGKESPRVAGRVKDGGGVTDYLRDLIVALWVGEKLGHLGDIDPDSPVARRMRQVLDGYRSRRAKEASAFDTPYLIGSAVAAHGKKVHE
jgi:hypothetical protein